MYLDQIDGCMYALLGDAKKETSGWIVFEFLSGLS